MNDYGEVTGGRAYESMVNEILSEENAPAVILLFAVFQSKWKIQSDYIPVGNHYTDTFGSAEVYIDGQLTLTLDGKTSGGWNNSNVVLILDEETVGEHTIEIRMVEGQEDKEFTILAFGYTN